LEEALNQNRNVENVMIEPCYAPYTGNVADDAQSAAGLHQN